MKRLSSILKICVFAFIINSCSKPGPAGPAGAAGQDGINGTNGNANVTSYTISVSSFAWLGSGNFYYYTSTSHPIQNADQSAVMAYLEDGTGSWIAIPVTSLYTTGDELIYRYNDNGIELDYFFGTAPPADTLIFKIVIIPPAFRNSNVNLNNYEEVKRKFNLKD